MNKHFKYTYWVKGKRQKAKDAFSAISFAFCLLPFAFLIISCSSTKKIPEGQYLLDKVEIASDNKKISTSDMMDFVTQQPNSKLFGLSKTRLFIYNYWVKNDSSKNLFQKFSRKMGEAPVIYNQAKAKYSAQQMQLQLSNWGYLDARVNLKDEIKDRKLKLIYDINAGTPYTIESFKLDIKDTAIANLANRTLKRSPIEKNNILNQEELEKRLETITSSLRNHGYYSFGKESFQYVADTTINSHSAKLNLTLLPPVTTKDSGNIASANYKAYKINRVFITSERNIADTTYISHHERDTVIRGKTTIYYNKTKFLKPKIILSNCYIRPGSYYNERLVELTHSSLSALNCVRQVNIQFQEVQVNDSAQLNCYISINPGNIHWIQTTLEGTNSAGDLGIGATVSYQHWNLFNGAETFRIKLRGAYEAVTGSTSTDLLNENYYEYGIETGVTFPRFLVKIPKLKERQGSTDIRFSFDNQLRPEYQRIFFNTGLRYKWTTLRNRLTHTLDIIDINYVAMPQVSQEFEDSVMNNPNNQMLKYSYENQFIYRTAYNFVYTSQNRNVKSKDFYTIRAGVEFAGNLFYGACKLFGAKRDSTGYYEIFNNPFAQYVKGDFDFSRSFSIDKKNSVAIHTSIGAAYPYLNSIVLPYEKRYYSGGSNSVRGWSTRQLGPGSYNNQGVTDFMNQSGDLKLDLSIEYRSMLVGPFQLAAFVDAGNIWTLRNYDNQPGGQFRLNSFYKQIALAWGLGFRFDLDFLVLRFDTGMKLFDPAQTGGDRWRLPHFNYKYDLAFHFAIGYPF